MSIYRGKMNWEGYADNEEFTVILPCGNSRLNDPIQLYWQWTQDSNKDTKVNVQSQTTITSVTTTDVKGETKFSCVVNSYYSFDITSKQSGAQLSIFMRNPAGYTSSEMILQKIQKLRVYAGKLNWYEYAVNEQFIVVLPSGLGKGLPVTAFWQWTKNSSGVPKVNCDANDSQRYDNNDVNTFYFMFGGYYTFNCKADDDGKTLSVTMKNPAGDTSGPTILRLQE